VIRRSLRLGPLALACVLTLLGLGTLVGALRAGEEDVPAPGGYAKTPEELEPYRGMGAPYHRFFQVAPTFRGPGRDVPEPAGLKEVRLGVLVPRGGVDAKLGKNMASGVNLAIEEANAAGGLRPGLPFRAVFRDEAAAWGAAANEAVDLVSREGVWGLIGALEDRDSHVLSRVLLKLETPTVNTTGPDPTLTEHMIPWLVRVRPDDRQAGYALVRRIFRTDGHRRVAVLRSNDRYGRTGIKEFVDAARRMHHPIAVEMRFEETTRDWRAQIERLRRARPDALLLWGRAAAAGRALRALHAAGFDVPVYGPDRLADRAFVTAAGKASEGVVFTYPFSPRRVGEAWQAFSVRFEKRFGTRPDVVAGYAYDGTRLLLDAIRRGGLNRVRIREALFAMQTFDGVTGTMRFDTTHNNISEIVFGHVVHGSLRID